MDETLKDNGDSTSTENLERNQSSKNQFTSENARKTTFFFFFSVSCLRTGTILFVALMKTSEKSLLYF